MNCTLTHRPTLVARRSRLGCRSRTRSCPSAAPATLLAPRNARFETRSRPDPLPNRTPQFLVFRKRAPFVEPRPLWMEPHRQWLDPALRCAETTQVVTGTITPRHATPSSTSRIARYRGGPTKQPRQRRQPHLMLRSAYSTFAKHRNPYRSFRWPASQTQPNRQGQRSHS